MHQTVVIKVVHRTIQALKSTPYVAAIMHRLITDPYFLEAAQNHAGEDLWLRQDVLEMDGSRQSSTFMSWDALWWTSEMWGKENLRRGSTCSIRLCHWLMVWVTTMIVTYIALSSFWDNSFRQLPNNIELYTQPGFSLTICYSLVITIHFIEAIAFVFLAINDSYSCLDLQWLIYMHCAEFMDNFDVMSFAPQHRRHSTHMHLYF